MNQHLENDTYNPASGPPAPKGGSRTTSRRQQRVPADLGRSRRVGLTAKACPDCAAKSIEGVTRHSSTCGGTGRTEHMRLRTGPLKADPETGARTSKDTGWTLA